MSVTDIKITPVNVYWQQAQSEAFDFTGKTGANLAGKYINLYPANSGTGHYVFFDTGSSTDPAPAGKTKISVSVATTDTAAQVATKFAAAVTAATGTVYTSIASGVVATVKRTAAGTTILATDGPTGNATGVIITLNRRGRDFDLGLLEGDVNLNFEPSNFEVKSHQTGVTPLATLVQGFNTLECSTTLLETGASKLEAIYNLYGGTYTTTAGNKVYGVGSAAQGKNLLSEAGRLILRPVTATDKTQDFTLMLAVPVPGALTFSGENPRKLEITWKGFIDKDFNPAANAIAIGDLTGEA